MMRPASLNEQKEAVSAEAGFDITTSGCIANRKQPVRANSGGINATSGQKCTPSATQSREDIVNWPQLAVQFDCLPDANCMPFAKCLGHLPQ